VARPCRLVDRRPLRTPKSMNREPRLPMTVMSSVIEICRPPRHVPTLQSLKDVRPSSKTGKG
jgi:hypothetical protein